MKNEKMSDALEKFWEKLKSMRYVLIVVAVGVILIVLPGRENDDPVESGASDLTMEFSLDEEERRIGEALEKIEGAGDVTVVLTLKTGTEVVLAEDVQSTYIQGDDEDRRESEVKNVIVSKGSSTDEPVVLKCIYPEYQGALVVASGADNAEIRLQLTKAVAGLTGLSSDAINIVKMKQ